MCSKFFTTNIEPILEKPTRSIYKRFGKVDENEGGSVSNAAGRLFR
jgi:hypothetical protein